MAHSHVVSEQIICRKIDFLINGVYRDYVSEPLTVRDNSNETAASFAVAIASCHQEAFELYEQQQFGEAMKLFAKAEQLCIDSQKYTPTPAQMLKLRCLQYQENPPAAGWNFT